MEIKSIRWFAIGHHPHEKDGVVWSSPFENEQQARYAIPNALAYTSAEITVELPYMLPDFSEENVGDGIKVRPINVGDIITVDNEDYKVLKIGPRNDFEKVNTKLLGQGMYAEKDGIDFYFLDIDVDYVNGESIFY